MGRRKSMIETMTPQQRQMAQAFLRTGRPSEAPPEPPEIPPEIPPEAAQEAPQPPSDDPSTSSNRDTRIMTSNVVRMDGGSTQQAAPSTSAAPTEVDRKAEDLDRSDPRQLGVPPRPTARPPQTLMPQRTFVSRTYRLAPHLVGTLNAAASERAQQRAYPYTREDILHEALSDWFKKQGYLAV